MFMSQFLSLLDLPQRKWSWMLLWRPSKKSKTVWQLLRKRYLLEFWLFILTVCIASAVEVLRRVREQREDQLKM